MSQSFLKELEEQLVERTERGMPQGRSRRGLLLATAPALAAAAAVIAVVVFVVSGPGGHQGPTNVVGQHRVRVVRRDESTTVTITVTRSSSTAPPQANTTGAGSSSASSSPPAGPVPPGFQPQSFTAISETTWWLLGQAPCAHKPCTSIVRTDDGGQSFVGIPAPRSSAVDELRFADASDGFAFGYDSALWVTHDAGRAWRPEHLGGEIGDVAASGGYVYVIVRSSNGHGRLLRAPVGGGRWTDLPVPEQAWSGLWAQGSEVILEAQRVSSGDQRTLVSQDDGASFVVRPIPGDIACTLQAPQSDVIWAGCSTGMMSGVWRSVDEARSYAPTGFGGANGLPQQPNSAVFAAASSETAVDGWKQLYRTTDGGGRWSAISGLPRVTQWTYLGFTDPTHGVAIAEFGTGTYRLYYTTDGGISYHVVPIGGS